MNYYTLLGKFVAHSGKRDELAKLLIHAAELLQRNTDCLNYLVSTDSEMNTVWVHETWTTKEAHNASLEPADIREVITLARPLIADVSEVAELETIGGKGL